MIYDPRRPYITHIKCNAMANESINSYVQNRTTMSATESLEDPTVEDKIMKDAHSYIVATAFSTIQDARVFFSADPEAAYDELLGLLNDEEIRNEVIAHLREYATPVIEDATPEQQARVNDTHNYLLAKRRVTGMRNELARTEKELDQMHSSLLGKYPDFEE